MVFAAALVAVTGCQHAGPPSSAAPQVRRAEAVGSGDLFPTPVALNVPATSAALNDTARFLAGLPSLNGQDVLPQLRASTAWKDHQVKLNEMWQNFEMRHAIPTNHWAQTHIPDLQAAHAVFYPFSGPDFIFSYLFYPSADTYVLCGLEPCEPLPAWASLTPPETEAGLTGLVTTLSSILQYSYFITKDMRHDLQSTRFRGVLPVFMVFLARSGHVIDSVDAVRLDANGMPLVFPAGQASVPGLLIRAHGPNGPKRIFYFSHDLSNGGFSAGSSLGRFADTLGRPAVFLKSASYLMHEEEFSHIREYLLSHTSGIVEDPSGVPLRHLLQHGWHVSYYGHYQGPIDTFVKYPQPDLITAYGDPANHAESLNFSVGYLLNPATTSLLVARPPH